jgi:endonuclease III
MTTQMTNRDRTERAEASLRALHELYPEATCELNYDSALDLLVATILSAQSTDANVNRVTPHLFKKYRTAADYANADPAEFEDEIRSTGFFRNKTRHVLAAARMMVDEYGGEVPQELEELVRLPGVARKTANVVLGTYFSKATGVVVDTHVTRVSYRIGLTDEKQPEKIEKDLMVLLPRDEWIFAGHALILHGRRVCTAKKPKCNSCLLFDPCLRRGVGIVE